MIPNMLFRFCTVGAVGFIVDAGILLLLVNAIGFEAFESRISSFTIALLVTWTLNKNYTFLTDSSKSTLLPYIILSTFSIGVSFLIFTYWITLTDSSNINLLLGVVFGSAAAAGINYITCKHIVFKKSSL